MKVYLVYHLPKEKEIYDDAINGSKYKGQLDDTWNVLFRPYFKHGYNCAIINKLLEKEDCRKLLERLVDLYREEVLSEDC